MKNKQLNGQVYRQEKQDHTIYTGKLIPCQTYTVLQRSFTDTATITFRNTGDTSVYMAWLATSADAAPPGSAIDVYPGDTHVLMPSQLGGNENRFLMVHNTSAVYEGTYEIEVMG